MTDYVIMPKADYEAACNAVREKTGKTDLIKSGDLSTEISGIQAGGNASSGAMTPYVFTIAQLSGGYNSTNSYADITLTSEITIPPNSQIVEISSAYGMAFSGSAYYSYPEDKGDSSFSVTETETAKTVTVTNISTTISSKMGVGHITLLRFEIPGFYKKINEDYSAILYADGSVNEIPIRARYEWNIKEVDLSQSVLTTIPNYAFYRNRIEKVYLPATVTTIGHYSFNCQPSHAISVDFTKHTSVPRLYSTNAFSPYGINRILVPAALYDEWIAATNWSTYADYIVAV